MQTHDDDQHPKPGLFLAHLQARAELSKSLGRAEITAGAPEEEPLETWKDGTFHVRQLPNDQQGILRISIGGGDHLPVQLNYAVFRGDHEACVTLLERALEALRARPK